MLTERNSSLSMLILLGVLVFIHTIGVGIYDALQMEPLPTFEFLYSAIFICGVIWWLRAEIKRSPVVPIYCSGMLVSLGWLVIIPYHLLKTRGLKGLIPLAALLASYVLALLLSAILYVILSTSTNR